MPRPQRRIKAQAGRAEASVEDRHWPAAAPGGVSTAAISKFSTGDHCPQIAAPSRRSERSASRQSGIGGALETIFSPIKWSYWIPSADPRPKLPQSFVDCNRHACILHVAAVLRRPPASSSTHPPPLQRNSEGGRRRPGSQSTDRAAALASCSAGPRARQSGLKRRGRGRALPGEQTAGVAAPPVLWMGGQAQHLHLVALDRGADEGHRPLGRQLRQHRDLGPPPIEGASEHLS